MHAADNNSQGLRGVKLVLRALRGRNYKLFFAGQGISLVGTWMQQVAMGWLVYRLTDSVFFLGVVGFASQIPTFFVAPFAGVLADRYSRRYILIATQILSLIQALVLAILVLTSTVSLWHIVALSVFIGLINAFDIPARQAFVYELVDSPEDLPNAIALNSMIFNGARLAGPSVAGILIAAAGEGVCFLANAVSFLAVLAALVAIKLPTPKTAQPQVRVLSDLKAGVVYAFGFVPIRLILILLAFISLVGMPYAVLMPVFARDILHGGPQTLGFLMGSVGVGALAGALFLASRKTIQGLGRIMVFSITLLGVGVIAFSFSQIFWLSMLLILFAGFGMMVQMASINTILQTIVDDDKRGRVMSLYTMAFMGMAPFGSFLAGSVAHILGAPNTLRISGLFCIFAAVAFWAKLPVIREKIHPIYIRKGIIPQVATGIGSATQLTIQTKE
jgi:MFS family permease